MQSIRKLPNLTTTESEEYLTCHSGDKKRQLCLSLGATEFLDFKDVDIVKSVQALTSGLGVHAVVCTANGERAYQQSMEMLRPLGKLVCVDIPNVPFRLPVTPLDMIVKGIFKQSASQ